MSNITYNKLVRDNIPKIIDASNKRCESKIIEGNELMELLIEKLQEEVAEYIESDDIEELADILEVIHGILYQRNVSMEVIEDLRIKKKEERGGFEKGIKLLRVY